MGDSFDESMKILFDKINDIKCPSFTCKKHKYYIKNKIKDMIQYLNEINRIETRLVDLNSNVENNAVILEIMKNEIKKNDQYLDSKSNDISIENYQIDELNNNKNMIDKNMDLYLNQLKKLFYIICALIVIYFIVISYKPSNQ
jgi:chromosome segregation ATPase